MEIWQYLVLFGSVLAGGGIAFLIKEQSRRLLKLVLSLTGAYILGITVLHLLPDVYTDNTHAIGLWILGGFFVQIMLEQLSKGVEHGHIHAAHGNRRGYALTVLIGLGIHSFLEGLPLSNYDYYHNELHAHDHSVHGQLLLGIILHKLPAAFALVLLLRLSGFTTRVIWGLLALFALFSPLGATVGALAAFDVSTHRYVLAVVIGLFLHISTTILFEADDTHHHRTAWPKLAAIVIGVIVAVLTTR